MNGSRVIMVSLEFWAQIDLQRWRQATKALLSQPIEEISHQVILPRLAEYHAVDGQ